MNGRPVRTGANPWVVRWRHVPRPRLRLFCFPYAGGGAAVYREWPALLPEDIEVCAIQPPGRENRSGEPLLDRVEQHLPPLMEVLRAAGDVPYATFGHSLGAMVSFEVVRRLHREGGRLPTRMFVSGRPAPQIGPSYTPIHELPDDEFCASVVRLNGTDADLFTHPELAAYFVPILRADFAVSERHRHAAGAALPVPVTAYCGAEDPTVSAEAMAGWAEQTSAAFALRVLAGDHFFLRSARSQLLADVAHHLRPRPAPAGRPQPVPTSTCKE
ncbi:thioesterase II family protein [Micromonospora lutea]|uniref:Thioesterase n=1 Tax=Micromonospora lutea TaxID=419825 RepID=A0ABQ4IYA4_9ACTN|nr:thioesterase [Micromonospora lutea]GIJ22900.1 thioesterase [Micromonospora lutea]